MSANVDNAAVDPNYVIDPNATVDETVDDAPDPVVLQSQLDELTRKFEHETKLREDAEKQSVFWYDKAIAKAEAAEPVKAVEPPAFDISDDEWGTALNDKQKFAGLVDRIATQRAQAIAQSVTDAKANAITGEQRRLESAWVTEQQRLPELADNKHPLTQLVAGKIRAMQQDESMKNLDPLVAMKLAISQAEADYLRAGGATKDDEEEVATAATVPRPLNGQRTAAIAAQAGSKGRKAAAPDKFANIPADQMELIQKHSRGLGIPVEKIIEQMPRVVKWK